MRDIHLYGPLADHAAPVVRLVSLSPQEALSGLEANFPGFLLLCKDLELRIVYGDLDARDPIEFDIGELSAGLGKQPLHIIPVPAGAKSGAGKIILGVALLGLGLAGGFGAFGVAGFAGAAFGNGLGVSWGFLSLMGGGMVLAGLAAPQLSDLASREPVDQRASYIYKGPTNTQEEGGPVPYLAAGNIITGGKIISLGVDIEQIPLSGSGGGDPTDIGGDNGTPVTPGPPVDETPIDPIVQPGGE